MRSSKLLAAAIGLCACTTALAQGPTYRLGTPASEEQIISDTAVMDAMTLPGVRMPNRDRFVGVELDWKPGQKRPLGFYPGK